MRVIGNLFKGAGAVVYTISGIWGLFLVIGFISDIVGFWGAMVALFLFPITFVVVPFYAGFSMGDWVPLILNYGGFISATVLVGIGGAISGD